MNNPRQTTKNVAKIAVRYGSSIIIYGIISNNVATTKIYQKIAVGIASFVLSDMVGMAAADYSDKSVDEVFDIVEKIQKIRFIN